ncbi:Prefoldin [Metschnikowia bicuspidata var. bicuspidata NRRL YB-4993]|uniref:Prefoldin n=1 Tax=Metschnikowia bicuspidata var. bicuspidata NRRL YB-4993 TaxID=869754 RepID=A0A1A0GZ33_9ASCO|nr:Prefoldin [Metschnikowia bicuspidata var. bicuspidata NRRL YB-4993]OBA16950.1 Prefoldin [Metschnikowia bicuspidata var. bicuspidata NRRL YB-4993]
MSDAKQQFEALSMEFTKAQSAMNELLEARSKLETQYQENKIVLEEFEAMDDGSKIYKLTGPVLMPQDYHEAKMNVSKRIEFIQGEISRVEEKVEKAQKDMEVSRTKLLQVRSQMAA